MLGLPEDGATAISVELVNVRSTPIGKMLPVWHAYAYGRLPWPRRVGRTFVLDSDDLAALQQLFEIERNDESREPNASSDRHALSL